MKSKLNKNKTAKSVSILLILYIWSTTIEYFLNFTHKYPCGKTVINAVKYCMSSQTTNDKTKRKKTEPTVQLNIYSGACLTAEDYMLYKRTGKEQQKAFYKLM